jgi:calcineurin-like phosphoesterase family protein
MKRTFYTADNHFGHANIIKYQNRPFADVEEMNRVMIENWNAVVGIDDIVYHLGDFALMPADRIEKLLMRLNGEIHIIWGNHDKETRRVKHLFDSYSDIKYIRDDGHDIVLCHYGMRVWNKSHHGSLHFYGHSHGNLPGNNQSLDVGVDCWDYTPTTLQQILQRLKTLPSYVQEDFHGKPKWDSSNDKEKASYG